MKRQKKLRLNADTIRVLVDLTAVAGGQRNTNTEDPLYTLNWPCYTVAPCVNGPTGAAATCVVAGCITSSSDRP